MRLTSLVPPPPQKVQYCLHFSKLGLGEYDALLADLVPPSQCIAVEPGVITLLL